MSVEAGKDLIRRVVDALNRHDLDAVDRLFAPDYVDHDPARAGLPAGPAGVKLAWGGFLTAFPDLHATIQDVIAEGDRVAVRGFIRGTHLGELMGIPPTGKTVTVTLIDITRIADGKLVERWAQADAMGMLQQLGVVPGATEATGERAGHGTARAEPGGTGDPEANRALALRYADLLLNRHELDRAAEILAPDFVGHLAGIPGPVCGPDAWKAVFGGFLAGFPDYRETVHDVLAEGDLVASRTSFTATHRGEFMGMPPSGRTVSAGGMAFLRIAGDRVVEQWTEADVVGMLQQLGVMPPSQGAG